MIKNRKIKISTLLISITAMSSLAFSLSSCGVVENTNANTKHFDNQSFADVNFVNTDMATDAGAKNTIAKLNSMISIDGTSTLDGNTPIDKTHDYVIYSGSQACPFCRLAMQGDITIVGEGQNEHFVWNPSLKTPNDGGDKELVQNTPLVGSITTLSKTWVPTKNDKNGLPVSFLSFEDKASGFGFDDIPTTDRGDDAAFNFTELNKYYKDLASKEFNYFTTNHDPQNAARWQYKDQPDPYGTGFWPEGIPIIFFIHAGKIIWNDTTWADKTNGIIDYDNLTDKENCMYYNAGFEKVFNQYFGTQK